LKGYYDKQQKENMLIETEIMEEIPGDKE